MANKDFEKMIKLGEWLEDFLDPNIKTWSFRKLFQQAINILDAEFPVDYEKTFVKKIESVPEFNDNDLIYNLRNQFGNYHEECKILEQEKKIAQEENDKDKVASIKRAIMQQYFSLDICNMLELRDYIFKLIHDIDESMLPWEESLAQIYKNSTSGSDKPGKNWNIINILGGWSNLNETFVMKENRLIPVRTFEGYYDAEFDPEHFIDFFELPYVSIISRVLLDFLLLGGQGYYLFCEHCGSFTVIRRKGRKKFCSDICRTNYGREKSQEPTKTN